MKKLVMVALFLLLSISSIQGKVTLNAKKLTLKAQTSQAFPITVTNEAMTYKSSNTKIATVNKKGVIKALKIGTCKITATASKKNYVCQIKVISRLSKTNVTLLKGNHTTLKLYGTTIKVVKSSKSKVASISKNGVIKAKKAGKTNITVKGKDGKSHICQVTVLKDVWGALHVKGRELLDQKGKKVQLRGLSTHGINYYPQYINQQAFKEFHDQGQANLIRLSMYTEGYHGYCSDGNKKDLKKLIKKGVNYAKKARLYAIIDWHILSDGNPKTHQKAAKAFFKEMSKTYSKENHVIYEICNEPNGHVSWATIKSYAKAVIPVIRQYDPDALIIVGTPTWSQDVDEAAKNPLSYKNVLYAFHFYAATHKDALRQKVKNALNKNLPIFVSEFGICDASGNGSLNKTEAKKWMKLLNQYNISYCMWNLSNKDESSALLKPSCKKTHGFTYDNLSESGKWLYRLLGSQSSTAKSTITTQSTSSTSPTQSTSGKVTLQIVDDGSWEEGDDPVHLYRLTIENGSENDISSWSIVLTFDESLNVTSYWNCQTSLKGKTLTLSPMDYNSQIPSKNKQSDIGLIIKGHTKIIQQHFTLLS